jgi:hypothetical protein
VQLRTTGLARLDAAITAFSAARAQVLAATGAIVQGAVALDKADVACATGSAARAEAARRPARAARGKVRTALAGLPRRMTSYDKAANELAAAAKAATSLNPAQREAVTAVVTGAREESAAADAFRVAGATAWPAYEKLDADQSLWLDRASGGWYRTTSEAAGAYRVLRTDKEPALARARALLERVDAARRPISERERAALSRADVALAPLRSPG